MVGEGNARNRINLFSLASPPVGDEYGSHMEDFFLAAADQIVRLVHVQY